MIPGLPAHGPASDLRNKLRLFGQFVGSWDILERRVPLLNARESTWTGEVHFNWVLGGRAVQDVWGGLDPITQKLIPAGTTIRFYDPVLDAWRSTWISPSQNVVRRFIGRQVDGEIILKEENRGGLTEHWVFADIRPNSFRWYALRKHRGRDAWRVVEEMRLERHISRRARRNEREETPPSTTILTSGAQSKSGREERTRKGRSL